MRELFESFRPNIVMHLAAESHVGRGRGAVNDAAELLTIRIHDPDPPGSAAIDIAFDVNLHAVGDTGLVAAQIGKENSEPKKIL